MNKLSPVKGLTTTLFWLCITGTIYLSINTSQVHAEELGEIVIDGEAVPKSLFAYYLSKELSDFKTCSAVDRKEKVIDLIIASKQYAKDTGTRITDDNSIISYLESKLGNPAQKPTTQQVKIELNKLAKFRKNYLEFRSFNVDQQDRYDEYKRRVRDKDPHITNLTIVRTLQITEPAGPDGDEKLAELATAIKNGTSTFEEAEAKYPSQYSKTYRPDNWITLRSLPHDIDKNTVKAGDIYGVENILKAEEYPYPMVKIYEVKTLPVVRLSDDIDNNRGPNPIYLYSHLREKSLERKTHLFMSELWANYSITEDGKPIQRVGNYEPCRKLL